MSKLEKLIARIKSKPKDFTWKEATTLMNAFGYELKAGGKTGAAAGPLCIQKAKLLFICTNRTRAAF